MKAFDRFRFLREFIRDPEHVGAVSPASRQLGDAIAAATRAAARNGFSPSACPHSGSTATAVPHASPRIFELGAGTGSLSQYLSGMNPVLVERNGEWAALLRKRFPSLEIRTECATQALATLNKPVGVVSSIPLLNNPQADAIKALLTRRYRDGLIRFCVLYTYGWTNPLAGVGFREARREQFVMSSLPPASVWVYR
jgi:phosphatidylethanolamine/phosphatidyl-N-methylethanolamine N-methyltransferase